MAYSTREISTLQKELAPTVYGPLDLDRTPERFRRELGETSILRKQPHVLGMLADAEKVEFFRQLTLMGDPLADAFAALIPTIGFPAARKMVDQAAEHGIDSVADAPPELVRWIRSMEEVPEWVDFDRIERAAKDSRLLTAILGEGIIRASFMVTYVNGYQGLPMVITGALSSESAAKRMKETVSTFKMASLPGALRRGGVAYQSAVKVRLMHAMVRTTLLRRPESWDFSVYGTPIPQVDQMGAGLLPTFQMARLALRFNGGRFSPSAAANVELASYLSSLLGLHDQFLSRDPAQIVETWEMVMATLRHQTDPRGRKLNDATIAAYRRKGDGPYDRAIHTLDVHATRFLYTQLVGRRAARSMGVDVDLKDTAAFVAGAIPLATAFGALSLLKASERGDRYVDELATAEIRRQLASDGPAEYRTDERNYTSARRTAEAHA